MSMGTRDGTSNVWSQVREIYRGLSLPTRVATIAAVAIVAVAVCYFGCQPGAVETVYLLGGQEFNDVQIQSFCHALEAEGLTEFRVDGSRLRVPRVHVAQYAAALAKRDVLPEGFYAAFDKAVEKTSWWSSSAQDDRRWELARQKALAQIIEQMPEVESANVMIDRSAPRGLKSAADIRATVSVKPRGGRELPPFRLRQIRNVVHGSVANMPIENVTVIDVNGKGASEPGVTPDGQDDLLTRMKEFEEHYARKIRSVLAYIPDVLVTVNVELDTTRQRRTEQVVWLNGDEPPNDDADARVTPRAAANAATELPAAEPTAPEKRPTQQQTWEEHVPLAPKSVTVSVAVPHDVAARLADSPGAQGPTGLIGKTWQVQVKDLVASAIQSGVTTKISVDSYPTRIDRSPATATSTTNDALGWRTKWSIAAVAGAAIAVAGVVACLRWRHRRRSRRSASEAQFAGSSAQSETADAVGDGNAAHARELVRVERSTRARGPHLVQASINNFEDLRRLAPASLQSVLGAVDSRLWGPALRGASRELCDRVLRHMPARAATLLREEIEYPGPVRLGDVEAAQQEILEVVRRLDHTGDLILEDREEVRHE